MKTIVDMHLSKLLEMVKDRETWSAIVHGLAKIQTWLSGQTTTCPLSQWCHPTISSSVALFSSCSWSYLQGRHREWTCGHSGSKGCCSVTQSVQLCDCMDRSRLPCLHHHLELPQTHVHWVSDAIQPTHPLSSPPPAFNLPSIRVFSNKLACCIRSFSFSISPSNEYSWLFIDFV